MARAYASIILKAPVETVWPIVRDFNGLPDWAPAIARSKIENGLDADVVGCVRSFHTHDGTHIRERLLSLDDARYTFTYNFEKPAFPVRNYIATLRLHPVTHGDATFAECENGGGKLGHGSGGIVPLRAEQNPSTLPFLYLEGGLGDPYRGTLPEGPSGVCQRDERAPGGASLQHIARECAQDPVVFGAARLPAAEAGAAAQAG